MSNKTPNPTGQDKEPVTSGRPIGDTQDRDRVLPPGAPGGESKKGPPPERSHITTPAVVQGGEGVVALGDERPDEGRASEAVSDISSLGSSFDGETEGRISAQAALVQARKEEEQARQAAGRVAAPPPEDQGLAVAQITQGLEVLAGQVTRLVDALAAFLPTQKAHAALRDDSAKELQDKKRQPASVQPSSQPQGNPKIQLGGAIATNHNSVEVSSSMVPPPAGTLVVLGSSDIFGAVERGQGRAHGAEAAALKRWSPRRKDKGPGRRVSNTAESPLESRIPLQRAP